MNPYSVLIMRDRKVRMLTCPLHYRAHNLIGSNGFADFLVGFLLGELLTLSPRLHGDIFVKNPLENVDEDGMIWSARDSPLADLKRSWPPLIIGNDREK